MNSYNAMNRTPLKSYFWGMSRLAAFYRVIARRVVNGVVHTYSKRTTQKGGRNGGYPQFGGKPTFERQRTLCP